MNTESQIAAGPRVAEVCAVCGGLHRDVGKESGERRTNGRTGGQSETKNHDELWSTVQIDVAMFAFGVLLSG